MTDESDSNLPIPAAPDGSTTLQQFQQGILAIISRVGLPTKDVLIEVPERVVVFQNIGAALTRLGEDQLSRSTYLSKFFAAAAAGLFDASLNYLWDETISELRRRIVQYDLSYFFDLAVQSPERRQKLSGPDDLPRVDDSDLLRAANTMGLISDVGYQQLDLIRYMRNWASAAHPNQNEISGLQLLGWLDTCIREVITLPLSTVVVEIKRLLVNIKSNRIDENDARQISLFFDGLAQDQVENLASGFFGIYTNVDSSSEARDNIRLLWPKVWPGLPDPLRRDLGLKYARFVANNDQVQADLARQLLDLVDATSYLPEQVRTAEIDAAVDELLTVHGGWNNFHGEPAPARRLHSLVGPNSQVPEAISDRFVRALVYVFLTNGHGVAWAAEPHYRQMIEAFDPKLASAALLSFTNKTIASRLQLSLPQQKFKELLDLVGPKLTRRVDRDLLGAVQSFAGPLAKMRDDARIRLFVDQANK